MINKLLLLALSLAGLIACRTSERNDPDKNQVHAFINDISDTNVSYGHIIDTYLPPDTLTTGEEKKERLEIINLQFGRMRDALKGDSSWTVEHYNSIPHSAQIVEIPEGGKSNVYTVAYKKSGKTEYYYFLIENGKVASFMTLTKGGNLRFFLKI